MGDSLVTTETETIVDPTAPAGNARTTEVAAPVKVNLELLDKLMNLVSEMVLARNRLLPFTAEFGDHNFSNTVRSIDLLTLELQERMMKTRMQPISQVWTKFPRLVRDIANDCHKRLPLFKRAQIPNSIVPCWMVYVIRSFILFVIALIMVLNYQPSAWQRASLKMAQSYCARSMKMAW